MSYYKVLLVDDEAEIRTGISSCINWEEFGFELVAEASNGMDAIEILEQIEADVVLTDIQMPFLDGLALCQYLKENLPSAKTVVFSGYDDFEYARKAMDSNVSRYVLKPIHAKELNEVLTEIKKDLDFAKEQELNMETLKLHYEESLPVLKQVFFKDLLDGALEQEELTQKLEKYDIPLGNGEFVVFVVSISEGSTNRDDLLFSAKGIIEKYNTTCGDNSFSFLYKGKIAFLCALKETEDIYPLLKNIQSAVTRIKNVLAKQVSVGVGCVYHDLIDVSKSTKQALEALEYNVVYHSDVLYFADISQQSNESVLYDEEMSKKMSSAVKLGNQDTVEELLSEIRSNCGKLDLMSLRIFLLDMYACILKLLAGSSLSFFDVFPENFSGNIEISQFSSIEEALEWSKSCLLTLCGNYRENRYDSNSKVIEQAKSYIASHYSDPLLNVEALCSVLHLSPAYFSTLFKKETQMNFISYVTDIRMKKAVEYLTDTQEKTLYIAEKIGYSDANYFSYVFKKNFGVAPSKYRSNLKNQE